VNRPIHPLFFAAYPVLFLYAQNLREGLTFGDAVWPLVVCLVASLALLAVAAAAFRDLHKGALISSVLLLLFFSYGHVLDYAAGRTIFSDWNFVLWLWGAIALVAIVLIARTNRDLERLSGSLNILAVALVVLNVIPIVTYRPTVSPSEAAAPLDIPGVDEVDENSKRDIYYFIFDRYPGPKTFKNLYHHDNSDFFGFLEDQGFYVADDTLANELKTQHSLASSLNMRYINFLHEEAEGEDDDQTPVQDLLKNPRLPLFLKSLGYRYFHVGSWFPPTIEDPAADKNLRFSTWSQFSSRLLEMTAWRGIRREFGLRDPFDFFYIQRNHGLYQFDKLAELRDEPGPKFVFAHVLLPHPPYVFTREGEFNGSEPVDANRPRMFEQLDYTNGRIKELVAHLLEGPEETDPIIVLQSDEGPHPPRYQADEDFFDWTAATEEELGEKLRILNAYYLPGVEKDRLYPSISPVNSFRLIFDLYFGADMPLLKDRSFVFHDWHHLYDFTDVTERLRPGESGPDE
jgi:hypothetical protein